MFVYNRKKNYERILTIKTVSLYGLKIIYSYNGIYIQCNYFCIIYYDHIYIDSEINLEVRLVDR